jgi:hypothetical protein
MAFEWGRIHKWEENYERDITEDVRTYVCEHYGVDDITELTEEQINEVQAYRDELNEYSVMQWGFSNIYSEWEMENA